MKVPEAAGTLSYYALLSGLKQRHDLTLIGICGRDDVGVDLNCPPDLPVRPGDTLFYIADQRVDSQTIDWGAFTREAAAYSASDVP